MTRIDVKFVTKDCAAMKISAVLHFRPHVEASALEIKDVDLSDNFRLDGIWILAPSIVLLELAASHVDVPVSIAG